jgi:hypothetical protein
MPVLRLVAIILLIAGAPFVLLGVYEAVDTQNMLGRFSQVDGTVVDNSYATTQDGSNVSGAYYPVIEFSTASGEVVRFTDGVGSLPPDYAEGASVRVAYDPAGPRTARLVSWKRLWFAPTLFLIIGLLPSVVFQLWRLVAAVTQPRARPSAGRPYRARVP